MHEIRDLADFLANAGSVVGGGAALGATLGFVAASTIRDLGWYDAEPTKWAAIGANMGGIAGIAALIYRALGVD